MKKTLIYIAVTVLIVGCSLTIAYTNKSNDVHIGKGDNIKNDTITKTKDR